MLYDVLCDMAREEHNELLGASLADSDGQGHRHSIYCDDSQKSVPGMEELVRYSSLKIASSSRLDSFRVSCFRRLQDQDDIFFSRLVSSRGKE